MKIKGRELYLYDYSGGDNMESFMRVFHGSGMIVEKPEVLISGYYKDFGYGFYCTNIEKQAKRWALTKRPGHVVNLYNYRENSDLNILKVYKRLILNTLSPDEDYVQGMIRVYNAEICSIIDNYNSSAYYEPTPTIVRSYYTGSFN